MTNTGDVDLTDHPQRQPDRPRRRRLHHPADTLRSGPASTCTYSAVVVRGTTRNTATADSAQTAPVSASATVVGLRPPLLAIVKGVRADPAADFVPDLVVAVGTTVTYRITVTNAGDVAVSGVTLLDDHSSLAGCAIPTAWRRRVLHLHVHGRGGRRHDENRATADFGRDRPGQRHRAGHRAPVDGPPLPGLTIAKGVRADPGQPYGRQPDGRRGDRRLLRDHRHQLGRVTLSGITLSDDHTDLGALARPTASSRRPWHRGDLHVRLQRDRPLGTTTNIATANSHETDHPETARATVVGVHDVPGHRIAISKGVSTSANGPFVSNLTV